MLKRIRELAGSGSQSAPPPDLDISAPSPILGTYVGWYLEDSCARNVARWCEEHGLFEHLPPTEMHTTIIYSKSASLPDVSEDKYRQLRPVRVLAAAIPRTIERFGPDHQALVVRFAEFGDALMRHYELVSHGLVSPYPEPEAHFHTTLSYTAGNISPDIMANLARNPLPFPLVYDREKQAPIKDDSYN